MSRDLKLLAGVFFLWALGEGLFFVFMPLYAEQLGGSAVQIGLLLALNPIGQVLTMIPAGIAVDRWGARPVLLSGWGLGVVSAAVMASASNLTTLGTGFLLYGLSGWVIPAITGYVAAGRGALPPERALARVFAAFPAGLIVSQIVGGQIAERFGLQVNFVLATTIFTLSTIALVFVRAQPVASAHERHGYSLVLRNRIFLRYMGVVFVAMVGMSIGYSFAPNFLQLRWDVPVGAIGVLAAVAALGDVVLRLALGQGPPRRAFIAVQLASMLYLFIILRTGVMGWLVVAFSLRGGAVIGLQFVDAVATRIVRESQQGLAFGISATVASSAGILAPVLAGWLYAAQPAAPFVAGLLLTPVAIVLTVLYAPRAHRSNAPQTVVESA